MLHHHTARGFTLVETLVAAGLLITAVAGLAQLFALSVHWTRDAAESGSALIFAQDKLERLRALGFGYGAGGEPLTDAHLNLSPPNTLSENVAGFVDWLDGSGAVLADQAGAEFARRWRVTALELADPAAIAIEVCVFRARVASRPVDAADVCLATARVRQP